MRPRCGKLKEGDGGLNQERERERKGEISEEDYSKKTLGRHFSQRAFFSFSFISPHFKIDGGRAFLRSFYIIVNRQHPTMYIHIFITN